jgi:hypothetical protein
MERQSRRRRPSRVGDVLPTVAAALGFEPQLRFGRQLATWQRLAEELVPAARDSTRLLAVKPPELVVSAASQLVAQELRLRQVDLLDAFARSPDGQRLLELRIVVRHDEAPGAARKRV